MTTGGGTINKLAKFDASTDITSSLIFDNGTNVGIGNTSPAAKLDVSGSGIFRGFLELPATGTATATLGFNSQPFDLFASSFNSSTHAAVGQHFRWQAEPVGNDTTSPLGKLKLLFASGTGTPAETGLSVSSTGIITFASGQTLPTVSGNETVTGNLSAGGTVNASTSFNLGGQVFAFGNSSNGNAFLGFSGNSTASGGGNTGSGSLALQNNTVATGNTADGFAELQFTTTGINNTGLGTYAGNPTNSNSMTGSSNTFVGYLSQQRHRHRRQRINNVNSATADALVGIGITSRACGSRTQAREEAVRWRPHLEASETSASTAPVLRRTALS